MAGQISDETKGVIGGQSRRQMLRPGQGILPLRIQAHREANLKIRRRNSADQGKTRPGSRAGGGDQNGSIKRDSQMPSRWLPSAVRKMPDATAISSGRRGR